MLLTLSITTNLHPLISLATWLSILFIIYLLLHYSLFFLVIGYLPLASLPPILISDHPFRPFTTTSPVTTTCSGLLPPVWAHILAYNCPFWLTTTYFGIQPPTTAHFSLQLPILVYNCLFWFKTACFCLQPPVFGYNYVFWSTVTRFGLQSPVLDYNYAFWSTVTCFGLQPPVLVYNHPFLHTTSTLHSPPFPSGVR